MKTFVVIAAIAALMGASAVATAGGNISAGKARAAVCAGCHGTNGISLMPLYPNLAGQKDAYLVKQLKAFKSGTRKDTTMNAMAAPLSDTDIVDIAAYFSSLK